MRAGWLECLAQLDATGQGQLASQSSTQSLRNRLPTCPKISPWHQRCGGVPLEEFETFGYVNRPSPGLAAWTWRCNEEVH